MLSLSVGFSTLYERKLLGVSQKRKGPNVVNIIGVLQPISDAIKLFSKEILVLNFVNLILYYIIPVFSLIITFLIWLVYPYLNGGLELPFGILYLICLTGILVYPIIIIGWVSFSKYRIIGCMRRISQVISYEISLIIIFLSIYISSSSISLKNILNNQYFCENILFISPLAILWLVVMLIETNRTPYDFRERESEIVSGFNTEYSRGLFRFIYIAEYAGIIFIRVIFVVLFLGKTGFYLFFFSGFIFIWFIWVRIRFPRFRYDYLISWSWKYTIPLRILIFGFYFEILNLVMFMY